MYLESLGADSSVQNHFQPYGERGLRLARVARTDRDHYVLLTAEGETAAEPSGALWYRTPDAAGMPVTGDWVAARVEGDRVTVEEVLPRKSLFSRRAAGRRNEQQPVAANIDSVFLVCGLDGDFNLRRLERYLALTAEAGAGAVIVLNKADLRDDLESPRRAAADVAGGAPVVTTSTLIAAGVDALRAFTGFGRTVALLGSSGVGKSAIVNRLIGEQRQRTGSVRESDDRGRHVTTARELIALPEGGALIDTPGMRELQLWVGQEKVDGVFGEIAQAAEECRFRDCSHNGEPGCAIEAALERGEIGGERWQSYRKLMAEARRHEELTDRQAMDQRKRRDKAMHKAARAWYKLR